MKGVERFKIIGIRNLARVKYTKNKLLIKYSVQQSVMDSRLGPDLEPHDLKGGKIFEIPIFQKRIKVH